MAISPGSISATPGLSALEIFDGLASGRVKAVWIICTNPAVSMPDLNHLTRALKSAALVVAQDSFHPTGTTMLADVVLPAAQWPEKEGVMTNSERRITYLPRLLDPPGEALPDWMIACRFAAAMGHGRSFNYPSAEAIFGEYRRLTAGTPIDITGVSYDRLRQGPIQWPCPSHDHAGTERLYTDYRFATADGRARFNLTDYQPRAQITGIDYPLILTTSRLAQPMAYHDPHRDGAGAAQGRE